jgi:hypothetical protein
VQRKLKPLREKEAQLTEELKRVTEELKKEEENNEKFFHELITLERVVYIRIQDN